MGNELYEMIQKKGEAEIKEIENKNERSGQFGLTLTEDDARELVSARNNSLKKHQRIELGKGILDMLIDTFCDSPYLYQDNYLETLKELEDIFYQFKNESQDQLSDDELMSFMKEQFDTVCYGDVCYLEETCLPRFAGAVRAGYRGYEGSGGKGEYEKLSEEKRWDSELYMEVLKDLCWR